MQGSGFFLSCAKGPPNREDAWAAPLYPRFIYPGCSSGIVMETLPWVTQTETGSAMLVTGRA